MNSKAKPADAEAHVYQALILGAGPGGTGPLVCAAQRGQLTALLDAGVAIVDRRAHLGSGAIGRYYVTSDSCAKVFLECLDTDEGARFFQEIQSCEAVQKLRRLHDRHAPLPLVGNYLDLLGSVLRHKLEASARCCFLPYTQAISVHLTERGPISVRTTTLRPGKRVERVLRARSVILALGGYQRTGDALAAELVPGLRLADQHAGRVMLTTNLLTPHGLSHAFDRLRRAGPGPVVIVGGSHSALSVAWSLLYGPPALAPFPFRDGDIQVLHRSGIRVYYPSEQEARADGYLGFAADDICPRTQRVHRLGGLRGDGRQLYRRVAGLGAEPREPRVQLRTLTEFAARPAALVELLDKSALIVPAFGYRPRTIPVYGPDGQLVPLRPSQNGPLVDSRCRILKQDGSPIASLFGIGLATGFRPYGAMGGEASFHGQTNGVWLYQNDAGAIILDQIMQLGSGPTCHV